MKKLIGSKGFYKMVLAICIPIVIQNGFTNLASLLDNIMIGQLGTLSMSGVSITNQLLQVFNVTIFGAMSGPGIFMAQFYGKKNKEGVENCFRIKLIIGIIITLLAIFLFYTFGQQLISLYLNDNPQDNLKTFNIYSIPVVGGGDGGVFINAHDMTKLWNGLFKNYDHWTDSFCNYTSLFIVT